MKYDYNELAKMIDHSLLNPVLTEEDLLRGIETAILYNTASVCVMPFYVKQTYELLKESDVITSTTIGFPHGVNSTKTKLSEALLAIKSGAVELDMVVNISNVLSEKWNEVKNEIKEVINTAHDNDTFVKVIFENCYLEDKHKIRLCEICSECNADWVKTSTGYGTSGATIEDLKLMRKHSSEHVQIKAAGGVRTLDKLIEVKEAGCTRAGATATIAILEEARKKLGLKPLSIINNPGKDPDSY